MTLVSYIPLFVQLRGMPTTCLYNVFIFINKQLSISRDSQSCDWFSSERVKLHWVTLSVKFEYLYLRKLSMIRNKVVWDKHYKSNRFTVRNIFFLCYSRVRLECIFNTQFFEYFYGFLGFVVWEISGHFGAAYQSHYCVSDGAFLFSFVYAIYLNIASYLYGKQIIISQTLEISCIYQIEWFSFLYTWIGLVFMSVIPWPLKWRHNS